MAEAERPHILICGGRGAGKSTLIRRLAALSALPVSGFITERLSPDATGFHPIYIHPAGAARREYSQANLIGRCDSRTHDVDLAVFDGYGAELIAPRPGSLIVMDELGFMEAGAERFTERVFGALDATDRHVLAAVKARYDVDFLNRVRAHPNAALVQLTPLNREAAYEELSAMVLRWNAG